MRMKRYLTTAILSLSLTIGLGGWAVAQADSHDKKPVAATTDAKDLPFPSGKEWMGAQENAKLAYLLGILNMALAEYQLTGPDPKHETLVEKLVEGLDGMTLNQIMNTVDTYYKAHPDRQEQRVVEVIWFQLVEPKTSTKKMK